MGGKKKEGKEDKGKGGKDVAGRAGGGALIIAALIILAAVAAALLHYPAARGMVFGRFAGAAPDTANPGDRTAKKGAGIDGAQLLQNRLVAGFEGFEMREGDYSIQYFPKDSVIEVKAQVPRGRPLEWIIWNLAGAAKGTPYSVDDCVCVSETNCTAVFRSSAAGHPRVTLKLQQTGRYLSNTAKMAILIENFGFEANNTTIDYLTFPEPLTVSLVPARKLAPWTAQIADEYKKEVVLLLPMEPLPPQYNNYRESMVMLHYNEDKIRGIFAQAAAAVPNFSGVCNFYGNSVMEDSRVMEIILSEVNRRKVYFVYTDVSRKSVVPQLVKGMKTHSYPVQGTIDANHTPEQVRERLRRHAMAAEKTGKILVKAQPSPAFIQVLKEEAPNLRGNGIRLVYVSELAR